MAGANNKALAKAGMKKSQIKAYRAMPLDRTAAAAVVAARRSPAVKRLGLRVTAGLMAERRKQATAKAPPDGLNDAQRKVLDQVRAGRGETAHLATLRVLQKKGMIDLSVKTVRYTHRGRTVAEIDVKATPRHGSAAPKGVTSRTFNGTVSTAQRRALAGSGFVAEQRGGDPKRSTFRNPKAPRTPLAVRLSRADGAAVTAADVKRVKAILAGGG